ncbi:ankyrin repeat domain-containing protein 31 [Elephas maximus indicus]|uniref:ankyrin repeat domain-containing protein 31 n=1 Tax=Elephas maximus indicus TaxID=99487 RepID=UPI00211619CF|nr:ankyrin repeat domain-containing protein 31 [Elephas maximus indicus]
MEEGAQAPDWDSDETMIEESVTESDLEEEELPWRRLLFDQDVSLRPESSLHAGISGMWKGMPSPEIQLGFKPRECPQEQRSSRKMMPVLSEDTILQSEDKMEQNQALLQTRTKCPVVTVSVPQTGLSPSHQHIQGPEAENTEVLPNTKKALSEDGDSLEISLLSGTSITGSGMVAVKEKSLTEPEKIAAQNTFSEPVKKVTLTMTSEENKDEESSLETFVSALERLLTSPESTQEERSFQIMSDFEPRELLNSLSDPLISTQTSLDALWARHRDELENTEDNALPAELVAALNTLSNVTAGPICHIKGGGSSPGTGNECLGVELSVSQTNEGCSQIAETPEGPDAFGLQTLAHQNVTSHDQLNNKGDSNPVENTSDQETPCVLRRSSRLKKLKVDKAGKHTHDMYEIPEKILPKVLSCEHRTNSKSLTKNSSMPDSALRTKGEGKTVHSFKLKSGEQIRKNKKFAAKNGKMKMSKMSLSSINRKNIFGENLLYRAALQNDVDLVHHCIKRGGNVNQPSYAGWTALHEASAAGFYRVASELLKGGADVNIKGKYQITPLHDAVMSGHYKVAELLLLNGADPLFRNDSGKCALDEAKDLCMKRLLERYVPKHQKRLTWAQRNSTDPLDIEDLHQYKKPKFSSKNCVWFVNDENSNRLKQEHVKVNKGSKEALFINKEDIYEYYQKDSRNTKFGKSKQNQSTVDQIHSKGFRKDNLCNVRDPSTNVSDDKGRRNRQHKKPQEDDGDCSPRKTIAVTSSRRINRLVLHQQYTLQTLAGLPEESCKPSSPALSSLTNDVGDNVTTCSISKETHTQGLDLDLSDNQEAQFLELESIDQTEVSFSDQSPYTDKTWCISPYKFHENRNSGKKYENFNKWENSVPSIIKGSSNDDDGGDGCSTEKAVTCKEVICSTDCKIYYNCEKTVTNREEMYFQRPLPSEHCFSQENELKAGSLTITPQQEAVTFSDSENTVISEQHVADREQYMYGISFDHSPGNPEQTSLACTRTLAIHEASELAGHMELFKRPQDYSPRAPASLTNQTETHIVEKMNEKQDLKRNYTDKDQKTCYSNGPLSAIAHSQVIETTKIEKRGQDLPESETIHNVDFHSTDNMNKELINNSQLNQRGEKEMSPKPDEELANNGEESTIRNGDKKKEKSDSEIHMPTDTQVQNLKNRQNLLKATCSQEVKTTGIDKRNAKGESRLHLAARRGNLSLVKALIESGADVNLKDNAGWTPLHEASSEGFSDIVVELLKAGANVNSENLYGILPLHDAVINNHLKAAEILLQHGANPNQKDQKQKSALDEADDEKMKELLKSYGAIETGNRDESDIVKSPAVRSKKHKQCVCDDYKTVDPPSLSHQEKIRGSLPVHHTISAILQDIEEKQEKLLAFEIRTSEDAEQYTEKMLQIKEVMDSVLAKQKAERDDLAKKYRVSIESFKHGALREQLANLATRQKSLLVVAKKQRNIRLKIQNYKNVTSLSGLSLRKLPSSPEISKEKDPKKLTILEKSVKPQSDSLSPANVVCRNMQEAELPLETCITVQNDSQNTNICLNSEIVRREEFSGNEQNSKQNVHDYTLDGLSKSSHLDGTEKIKLPSQSIAFIAQVGYSQKENDFIKTTAKECESCGPSTVTGALNISPEITSVLAQKDAHPTTIICDQALSSYDPKTRNKTASQQPPRAASESLAHQRTTVFDSDTVHQMKSYLKKSASTVPCANDSQIIGSGRQHTTKKPLNYSTAPRKKRMQIKDLILLGRINPGNNILEFKTQEATHKASILLSGKIKVENGQIYQNPVTWLKDLLGGDSSVTWNYAWSKVTYLGRELLKYVSEEVPMPPEPNLVPQQCRLSLREVPCLDDPAQEPSKNISEKVKFGQGTYREPMQSNPHYLQINEILLISDQEFLPCHIMDQHWKFYAECEELTF